MIHVMIIDEQTLFREGIKAILKQHEEFEVVASLERGKEVLEYLERGLVLPDVILVNLQLKTESITSIIRQVKKKYPMIRILALIEQIEEEIVIDALLAEADGFLLKQHYGNDLIKSIKAVQNGDTIISGPIAKKLANRVKQLSVGRKDILLMRLEYQGYHFTNRELDIAFLLKSNYTNKEIARALHLEEGTVKNYISEIYNKLNIRTRRRVIELLQEMML